LPPDEAAIGRERGLDEGELASEQLREAAGVLSASRPSTFTAELPFASNLANCAHGEV
jgi:hypothetical protein